MDWKDMITWGLLLYIASQTQSASGGCGCGGASASGCPDSLSQTTPQWMMGPLRPLSADFSGGMWG